MLSYPLVFHFFGTALGAVIAILVYNVYARKCSQQTIVQEASRTSLGWTWGILGCITIVHGLYVAHVVSIASSIVFIALLLATIALFVSVSVRRPVSMSPGDCNR